VSLPHVDNTNENSVFAAIMALRALYPNAVKWNDVFMPSIQTVFVEHHNVIDNEHIGFPDDWEIILRK